MKKPVAERLGWVDKPVTVADILAAVSDLSLRIAMTSATQSNSGAAWHFSCLSAFADRPEVLQSQHLADPGVREQIKKFLGAVDRSVGSTGWLKTMLLEQIDRFEAMVNYEALVIEANRERVSRGLDPLYVVYTTDGVMIADSPLAYVNNGDAAKEALFTALQEHLLSGGIQDQILRMGRRTGLVGLNPDQADRQVFNPAWGIDVGRILSPIRTPSREVVQEA